jgi:flagellar FliL protein
MSNEPHTPAAAAKKKSKRTLILAIAGLMLLGGGGGAAYWQFAGRAGAAHAKSTQPQPAPEAEATAVVALEPFVVNLADTSSTRFLRITLSLVVDEEHAKELTEKEVDRMKLRSALLELLSLQMSDTLVTPQGKTDLKKAIVKRAGETVHGLHVADVLFSEFVVQF